MENTNNSLTVVAAQEGHSVSVVGDTYRIIIGSEQTNGAYAFIDMLIPPKGGPGPHSHAAFQEAFYIIGTICYWSFRRGRLYCSYLFSKARYAQWAITALYSLSLEEFKALH